MPNMPMQPGCTDFVPINGELPFAAAKNHGASSRREHHDCTECVYFSRRNCGHDTENMDHLFDQPLY